MLRHITCGRRFFLSKHSRSLQFSSISNNKKEDGTGQDSTSSQSSSVSNNQEDQTKEDSISLQSSSVSNNQEDQTKKDSILLKSSSALSKQNESKEEHDEKYWQSGIEEDPFARTYRVMSKEMREIRNNILFWKEPKPADPDEWDANSKDLSSFVDIAIIGSGAISNSIAYWLKKRGGKSFSVLVIEPEHTYTPVSPVISAGGLRMQYSMEENIEMSMFSAEFIRDINEHLKIENKPPIDVKYHPYGFLHLASESGAEQLEFNSTVQNSMGIKNRLLTVKQLNARFPWLNTENIALGSIGLEKEGWFDPDVLTMALKRKSLELGVEYATGEVKGFIFERTPNIGISSVYRPEDYTLINNVVVKTASGDKHVVQFSSIVLAAGYQTTHIAELARIGKCRGILSVPLPIDVRKRFLYLIDAPDGPGLNTPMTFDPSGCFFRRDGLANHYIVGRHPQDFDEEPMIDNLEVDPNYYYDNVWPALSYRVPSFENAQVRESVADYYEYNKFDESGVIGRHPLYANMLFATGFGFNSIPQSPAIGRGISELILDVDYRTIDLTRLSFERFITLEPQMEVTIT